MPLTEGHAGVSGAWARVSTGTLAAGVLVLLLGACQGLPDQLVRQAQVAAASLESAGKRIDALESEYRELESSAAFAGLSEYAGRENWESDFGGARSRLSAAEAILADRVQPILERNSPDDAAPLQTALKAVPNLVAEAIAQAGRWTGRRELLERVAADPAAVVAGCNAALDGTREALAALEGRVSEARSSHPSRAGDVDRLAAPLQDLLEGSSEAAAAARSELAKQEATGEADLAVIGDSCELVSANWEQVQKADPELRATLAELDRSYSRTLIDMKVDYELLVRRQSWDDRYEYPQLHNTDYRIRPVAQEAFEHLTEVSSSLAYIDSGWRGMRLRLGFGVDSEHWKSLQIDPTSGWRGGHDAAEFWVQDGSAHCFHKYLVEEDGKTSETDWVPVNEDFFLANVDNLGMDVESKPYGSFESEKLTEASPPGMAYVGNPRYGRWVADGRGGSVWNWVGPYLFYRSFFGSPMRYGRSEWDQWSRDYRGARPYYGGSPEAPRWGTRGRTVQTSPRMGGSTFVRRGGLRRPAPSVRGAGPLSRGGSFGGSGK